MEISVSGQALAFLFALLFGAVLGVFYDLFRISRIALRQNAVAIFIEDLFFWIVASVATFLFLLFENSGEVRVYLLLGVVLGAILYYFTLGILVMKLARLILTPFKRVCRRASARLFSLAGRIAGFLSLHLKQNGAKAKILMKKQAKLLQIRLKLHPRMLYNQRRSTNRNKAANQAKGKKRRGRRRKKHVEKKTS